MFKVTKVIHFCYGHRLLRYEGKCRHLHGHNARVEIELTAPKLDRRGMVMDFNDVKRKIQGWIDASLDHRMILNARDPVIPKLKSLREPFITVNANPTAETLAKLIFDHARKERFPVTEVQLWETETSFATYRG